MATKRLLFLDFETFYSDDYSLTKMPTPNYILDPRWETILCSVKEDNNPAYIVDGPDMPAFLASVDPKVTTTVTYNALFDNSILAWRYGWVPDTMLDSMSMAKALKGHQLIRFSLANVAEHLGLGVKGNALVKVKGMRREQIISAGLWPEFCAYANQDNELNAAIFRALIKEFPWSERRLMDLVIRTTVEPKFHVDVPLLRKHLAEVRQKKADLLNTAGVQVDELMSSAQFVELLKKTGVAVQYKESPRVPGKQIPALAKTDEFMNELLEHPDPTVQALAAARVGHKSTLEETRSEKLISIAELPWPPFVAGGTDFNAKLMPIPLGYGGPHTHRLSGVWGMNMQNMTRGSNLRKALLAPPGYKVIVSDLGQIEARLVAWICRQTDLLQEFRDKKDPYAILASYIFGREIIRSRDKAEGFVGKTGILGLGYGCGVKKFYDMVLKLARAQGVNLGSLWTYELAEKSVKAYRGKHFNIHDGWRRLDGAVAGSWLSNMNTTPFHFGPTTITKGCVALPSGLNLNYDTPAHTFNVDAGRLEYFYCYGKEVHKLYGAKLLENIVQALARIIVMNAALRLNDRGYRFVLQAHDELAFIVPDVDVDNAKKIVQEEMTRSPSWASDLPLTADTKSGISYGDAK